MTHNIAQLIETGQDAKIARLEAEVGELRRDRERLAWLQSKVMPAFVVGIGSTQNDENEYWYQVIVNDASGETVWSKAAPTLGGAIDAAMTAEEEPCPQLSE